MFGVQATGIGQRQPGRRPWDRVPILHGSLGGQVAGLSHRASWIRRKLVSALRQGGRRLAYAPTSIFSGAGGVFSTSETRSGWTVGIGGEYAFLDWLTGFIEYDHYGFRDNDNGRFGCGFACPVGTFGAFPVDFRTDVDVVKAGLNVKFGGIPICRMALIHIVLP